MYVSDGSAKAPMDFAIVAGWQALATAILPKEIDGDLLRLVHLSNEVGQKWRWSTCICPY